MFLNEPRPIKMQQLPEDLQKLVVQRSFEPGHINSKNHSLIDAMIKGVTGLWQNEVFRRVDSAKFFKA